MPDVTTEGAPAVPRRRTSLRDEQKRMTRERLVRAAYEIFGRSGYSNTSILDITNAVDVNRATFYLHFAGKAEIIAAAAEQLIFNDVFPYWTSLDEALSTGTRESIMEWLAGSRDFWRGNSGFLTAWAEAAASDAAIQADREKVFDLSADWLPRYKASFSSSAERDRALVLVRILTAQLETVFAERGLTYSAAHDPQYIVDVVGDIWCRSLRIDA
jgi:AcrR family transcriptional regulator